MPARGRFRCGRRSISIVSVGTRRTRQSAGGRQLHLHAGRKLFRSLATAYTIRGLVGATDTATTACMLSTSTTRRLSISTARPTAATQPPCHQQWRGGQHHQPECRDQRHRRHEHSERPMRSEPHSGDGVSPNHRKALYCVLSTPDGSGYPWHSAGPSVAGSSRDRGETLLHHEQQRKTAHDHGVNRRSRRRRDNCACVC